VLHNGIVVVDGGLRAAIVGLPAREADRAWRVVRSTEVAGVGNGRGPVARYLPRRAARRRDRTLDLPPFGIPVFRKESGLKVT